MQNIIISCLYHTRFVIQFWISIKLYISIENWFFFVANIQIDQFFLTEQRSKSYIIG